MYLEEDGKKSHDENANLLYGYEYLKGRVNSKISVYTKENHEIDNEQLILERVKNDIQKLTDIKEELTKLLKYIF
jgi:hypothetical protein